MDVLNGMRIYIHPAALGKTRQRILADKIEELGGVLTDNCNANDCIVLLDVQSIPSDKVQGVVKKIDAQTVLRLEWLTNSIKNCQMENTKDYQITVARKQETMTSLVVPCSENVPSPPACASASTQSQSSKNQRLVKELDKLATIYKSTNDKWRAYAYQKAISALKRHPVEITSPSQARKIPSLGPKMITKIIGDVQLL